MVEMLHADLSARKKINGITRSIMLYKNKPHPADAFISEYDASYYAKMYKHDGYSGGHIIILNPEGSEYYEKDLEQAELALSAYPNAMQIGGGININNAEKFLDMGATHVIVTSYVFCNGMIDYERLKSLSALIGKEHLVLDLKKQLLLGHHL